MNPQEERPPDPTRITAAEPRDEPVDVLPVRDRTVDVAEVTPVPQEFRQHVRGPGYKLRVNLLDAIPALYFVGGIALTVLGAWLIGELDEPLGGILVVVGLPATVWGAYSGLFCMCVYSNRWIERRLRYEIGQRPDLLVDPRDPESLYVSLIPRESFSEVRWTFASDLLLLKFDLPGRQILLEGDSDRYRIPAAAIVRCAPKAFSPPLGPGVQLWVVRLVVDFEDETRELLLCHDHTRWTPHTGSRRWRTADQMCRRIDALLD